LYGKPVPGLAFFTLSLISTSERRSFPMRVEQVLHSAATPTVTPATLPNPPAAQGKPGRPKERTTTDKTAVTLSPELQQIQGMVQALLQLIGGLVPLTYLVLDEHFGTNTALQMTGQCQLQLISKLCAASALYLRYDGPYAGRGPRRIYGAKINYRAIADKYLHQVRLDQTIATRIYQIEALHKAFAQPLNVVISVKTNLKTQAHAPVIVLVVSGCSHVPS
jgi:putative transposase